MSISATSFYLNLSLKGHYQGKRKNYVILYKLNSRDKNLVKLDFLVQHCLEGSTFNLSFFYFRFCF